jgi:2Fe-2S ferredoxin
MIKVTFRTANNEIQTVEARGGMTLMETAMQNGVEGIEAQCGGACSCATCHVYVDRAWVGRLDPPSRIEADMLEAVGSRRPESRLSCQIKLTAALDGLSVETPASQG